MIKTLSDLLSPRPGGAPWLMQHALHLFVADAAAAIGRALHRAPNRSAMPMPILGWIVAIYLTLHVAAWGVLPTLPYWRSSAGIGQLHVDGAGVAVLFILMLSAAMIRCVHVMYSRTDLDLLLCSPVSGATVLRARLGGVVLGTLLLLLFLLTPIIHVGLFNGRLWLLALYPGLLAMATIAASLAMMIAIQLARLIGPRYTGMVAQVPGTVVIVGLYFLPGLQRSLPAGIKATLSKLLEDGALLGPASPLWLPVHALRGHLVSLCVLCLVALGLAQLAVVLLQRSFVRVQQQRGNPPGRTSGSGFGMRLRFGRSMRNLVLYKEWLLISRQPMSLNQLATKLVWPVVALVAAGTSSLRPLVIASIIVYGTAALAGTLTRLIESGEQAWDLLASAPVAPATIGAAKRWAVLIPTLSLGMPAALWLVASNPTLGILTAIAMTGACGSANRLNRIDGTRLMAPNRHSHSSAPQWMTSLKEVLSNGVWVLMLVIAYAIFE